MEGQAAREPVLLRDGVAAARAGDLINARALLNRAVAAQPQSELAWLWLASVAETPGEAINCWRRTLEINPQQEHARAGLRRLLLQEGIALARAGARAQSREMLRQAAEFEPDNEIVWLWLASVAEKPEEAVRYIRRVLDLNPKHQRATEWLARLQPKNWPCPICQTLYPEQVEKCQGCRAVLTLAQPEQLLNNTEADQALLQSALARYESFPKDCPDFEIQFNLGLAYLNQKRFDDGLARLKQASQLRPADTALRNGIDKLTRWHQAQQAALVAPAAPPVPAVGEKVVLVVDDSPTIRKLVSVTLERQGYRVVTASGGVEAMGRLKEIVPDLILLDITMPHMDGYQLCRLIKGDELTRKVPVIMLSGKDGFFDKVRGRMVGASEYITKPFEPALLLQTVERSFT
jgi:twitching motility two-component system response regulator PilG